MTYLIPLKVVLPFFVHQTDRKGCTLDYLYDYRHGAWLHDLGHFLFSFGATGKKSLGGGNNMKLLYVYLTDRLVLS